ncbi:putative helicase senataxin [Caerostris darwini]|uniref:Helicase senataxin n=1 Tax=Caerostris darwini TaxID=1538125 RepID=A0AAV4PUJ2_9ARAC|nr:putative helicase senataxin [Caerostris darwini]
MLSSKKNDIQIRDHSLRNESESNKLCESSEMIESNKRKTVDRTSLTDSKSVEPRPKKLRGRVEWFLDEMEQVTSRDLSDKFSYSEKDKNGKCSSSLIKPSNFPSPPQLSAESPFENPSVKQMTAESSESCDAHENIKSFTKDKTKSPVPRRPSGYGSRMEFLIDMPCEYNRVEGSTPHTDYISEAKVPDENARNPNDVKSISAYKNFPSPPQLTAESPFENPSVNQNNAKASISSDAHEIMENITKDKITLPVPRRPSDDGYPMGFLIDIQCEEHKDDNSPPHIDYITESPFENPSVKQNIANIESFAKDKIKSPVPRRPENQSCVSPVRSLVQQPSTHHEVSAIIWSSTKANPETNGSDLIGATDSNHFIPITELNSRSVIEDIIQWSPNWLEEQSRHKTPPPRVSKGGAHLPLSFSSHEFYVKSVYPMIILEIWESLFRESKPLWPDNQDWHKFFYIISSIKFQKDFIELHCESVVNEELSFCPREGDVILLISKPENEPVHIWLYRSTQSRRSEFERRLVKNVAECATRVAAKCKVMVV